jgi:hypothetical protein
LLPDFLFEGIGVGCIGVEFVQDFLWQVFWVDGFDVFFAADFEFAGGIKCFEMPDFFRLGRGCLSASF